MGYTHGCKWTLDDIKARILEVVAAEGLGRMPSRSECEAYYNNTSLTNAVSRSIGWYALAKEIGLPIKDSDTYFGKLHEENAQKELSAMGYDVRRMSQNFPYDLLINGCVKVDVKASRLFKGKMGNFYAFNLEKPFCTCDIYLLYCLNDDGTQNDTLIIPSKFVAFNTQISVGETKSVYHKYSHRWDYIQIFCDFNSSVG